MAGCWDVTDIEDRSIPIVAGYDLLDKDRVRVSSVTPNFSSQAKVPARIEVVEGKTVIDTRNERASFSPQEFMAGMIQVAVFGENLASEGLEKYYDSLFRIPEISNFMKVAVADGDAYTILTCKTPNYDNNGVYLKNLLNGATKNSFLPSTTLFQLGINVINTGENPVLPLLQKRGDKIIISGTAIFDKDKMIAKLNRDESRSLVLLRGIKARGAVPFKVQTADGKVMSGTATLKNSRKVKVQRSDGKYRFEITVKLEGMLAEQSLSGLIMIKDQKTVEMIENAVAREIEGDLQRFIQKMQNSYEVDCIDITRYALAKWRREIKDQVGSEFIKNADINVKVKVHLKNVGEVL